MVPEVRHGAIGGLAMKGEDEERKKFPYKQQKENPHTKDEKGVQMREGGRVVKGR